MWNLKNHTSICNKVETDLQIQRTNSWYQWGEGRGSWGNKGIRAEGVPTTVSKINKLQGNKGQHKAHGPYFKVNVNEVPSIKILNHAVPAVMQCIKESDWSSSGHCRGVGSIPGLVQWVKESGIAAAAA